jgi:hypothetical protein
VKVGQAVFEVQGVALRVLGEPGRLNFELG